jgi:adenylosuccinate synthase
MMKSDVLNGMEHIEAAVAYEIDGVQSDEVPANLCTAEIKPVYQRFQGWPSELPHDKGYEALDLEFRNYVDFIEKTLGAPVKVISLGPERHKTVMRA